ncbi:MAG: M48 family metalloprotease [Candidatus Omnitrophica bacterium]|nr:M48 family metalloprotease [Candidatus Omnitrophota bacterium]
MTFVVPPQPSYAQSVLNLPLPGMMITRTSAFIPPMLTGMKIAVNNPFHFDFILDSGDVDLNPDRLKEEANKLIKYFLASLTIPEDDLWVNLSPYEKDRIVPNEFGMTEMGRDLLAQDYILKQLTASLIYPEEALGQAFWKKIYQRAQEEYGTTEVPVNTFNKVWIVPEKAVVYQNGDIVYVIESHLKVMLEEDYVALEHSRTDERSLKGRSESENQNTSKLGSEVIREIILPEIEKEVNEGKNFSKLRQVYNSLILAKWYKQNLKQSILNQKFSDRKKIGGVEIDDPSAKEKIYAQYLEAFKQGVYNYIKDEYDAVSQEIIPRKYFSGGMVLTKIIVPLQTVTPDNVTQEQLAKTNKATKRHFIAGAFISSKISPETVNEFMKQRFNEEEGQEEELPPVNDPAILTGSKDVNTTAARIEPVKNLKLKETTPKQPVYKIEKNETYDEILIEELAKKQGISVDDVEANFERNIVMIEKQMEHTGILPRNTDMVTEKMHTIFDRLIDIYTVKTKDSPGELRIIDSNEINAFVIRNRTDVYFFKGLYEALYDIAGKMNVPLTEDAIAFVMAHELSHSIQNTTHYGLNIRDFYGSETLPYLLQMIKNGEYDADMVALELMNKAGYSVLGAIDAMRFLEYMQQSSQAENILDSHPYISLRKHKLSQLIYEQKTNIFTNIKAPRVNMAGEGEIKSQDVDFRLFMDASDQDLLDQIQNAESVTALDELTGMLVTRRRMNFLKALVKEKDLKTSFLRNVYVQAVHEAMTRRLDISVYNKKIDYSDMRSAAAIYEFGQDNETIKVSERKDSDFYGDFLKDLKGDVETYIRDYEKSKEKGGDTRRSASGKDLLNKLNSITSLQNSLSDADFDNFLLPLNEVEELIPMFTDAKDAGRLDILGNKVPLPQGKKAYVAEAIFEKAIKDPKKLISAFFYAKYIDQQPSVNVKVPTTDVQAKLRQKSNSIYLQNPSYRDIQSADTRKNLQNIILLQYILKRPIKNINSRYLDGSFPGVDLHTRGSQQDLDTIFLKYYNLLLREHSKSEALNIARQRLKKYFDIELGRNNDAIDSLLKNDPDLWVASQLNTTEDISSPRLERIAHVPDTFQNETGLDYNMPDKKQIKSFKALSELPDWALSEYLDKNFDEVASMIKVSVTENASITELFSWMKDRLDYDQRRRIFESVFLESDVNLRLTKFFISSFKQNPQEVAVWFLGMFSKNDALKLTEKLVTDVIYRQYLKAVKDQDNDAPISDLKNLQSTLLEYLFSQTSKTFQASEKSGEVYLALLREKMEESGKMSDQNYVDETIYSALTTLSAATPLRVYMYQSRGVSKDEGTPDFKSGKTSIMPEAEGKGSFKTIISRFALHNFGWNDNQYDHQSIFLTSLTNLSIDQLKQLLKKRLQYVALNTTVEYRGEDFSLSGYNDFFANLMTLILFKKLGDPKWMEKNSMDRLDDLMELRVSYSQNKDGVISASTSLNFKFEKDDVSKISYAQIKENLLGVAIPNATLDTVWENYIIKNNLQGNFLEVVPLLQNPNVGNQIINDPIGFLKDHTSGEKVPYRKIMAKFFKNSSVYTRLINEHIKIHGEGYVYGDYKPLPERLNWLTTSMPHKSLIKDGVIDMWETDVFPEIIADLPALVKLARQVSGKETDMQDMWTLLGEMDDDVGRLEKLNQQIEIAPERIYELLDFYQTMIPLLLSPQKTSRYGATAYMLWKQLPENTQLGLTDNIDALTKFMPEPSILRDDLLMQIANKYVKHLEEVAYITKELYVNNLLSPNKDLRTHDFISETVLHLFGAARMDERKDILLWVVGAQEKPKFVVDAETKLNIDFTTLPSDVKLLPSTMRDKFIEGFMLGDNGVLDPQDENDVRIMSDFLEKTFIFIFPENMPGLESEARLLLQKVFLVVMKKFPAYRRVHVIKALAQLRAKGNFEKTSVGERLAVFLGVLGSVGIKVSQYLSENETLVPDKRMRSNLGSLRNNAPEITKIASFSVLENEIPFSDIFVQEMDNPVGVASIKQVNRGKWLDIELLSQLVLKNAKSEAEANEIRSQLSALFQSKDIMNSGLVAYIVAKANQYKIKREEAGVPVVYKIRRPDMEVTLDTDFTTLESVSEDLQGDVYRGEAINLGDLVQTVKEWVTLEMDFMNEVKFSDMLTDLDYSWSEDLQKEAGVHLIHPKIFYATKSLIVEQEIQGIPILNLAPNQNPVSIEDVTKAGYSPLEAKRIYSELVKLDSKQAHIILGLKKAGFSETELNGLSEKLLKFDYDKLRSLLRQLLLHNIFVDGVFHADLHQANVMITPDGGLVLIDRGNVGTLNKKQSEGAKVLFKGLLLREKDLIKTGIDTIFINTDSASSKMTSISLESIQEVLDKGFDLKMTMNMISMRAVSEVKNSHISKNFSTFLKAFTQAMYLFPTDWANGMETLQTIGSYISLSDEDTVRAAQEQAKYIVVEDIERDESNEQEQDFRQILKKNFYEKTNRYFLSSLWQPAVYKMTESLMGKIKFQDMKLRKDALTLVKIYGPQILEDNINELIKKQDAEIKDVVGSLISVSMAERMMTAYIDLSMKESKWAKLYPAAKPVLKGAMLTGRPLLNVFVEASKEWTEITGKKYIENAVSNMTVSEGIEMVSQLFPEDFKDFSRKFENGKRDIINRQPALKNGFSNASTTNDLSQSKSGAAQSPTGGVDFSLDLLELEIRGQGNNLDAGNKVYNFENIQIDDGLMPVIINVTPITNLPLILGAVINTEDQLSSIR